jgi:hypothetical protein
MTQSVQEQIGVLPAIEAESHFLAVGLQVLRADFVPRSNNSALEQRECGFDGIGVDVAAGINAQLVADGFVPSILSQIPRRAAICLPIIREQDIDIFADIFSDVLLQSAALGVRGMKEAQIAATLPDADNDFLVFVLVCPSAPDIFSANKGFVHFDFAAEQWSVNFDHRVPDAVTEKPCGLIADSERALNLASGHALLGFAEKQGSHKPFGQRQVGIVEHCASRGRKLVVAALAVVEFLFGFEFGGWRVASHTLDARGPAKAREQFATLFVGRVSDCYVG